MKRCAHCQGAIATGHEVTIDGVDYHWTHAPMQTREDPAPHMTDAELRNRFFFHPPPDQARITAHEQVSELCYELAYQLASICPPGRNLSLTLTHLEDVRMRANAALACDSPPTAEAES